MAKLEGPLLGDEATGVFNSVLSYRRTLNFPTVAKPTRVSTSPSPGQLIQRAAYGAAVSAWNNLTPAVKAFYTAYHPENLSGYNFFIRMFLVPDLFYFFYIIFEIAWFQDAGSPGQPALDDAAINFPSAVDVYPSLQEGAHSPQGWLFNQLYAMVQNMEDFLIEHKSNIEGGE